ncbi:MAG: hypothetical protein ABSC61_05665, partial [Anaerolineales bacterium]
TKVCGKPGSYERVCPHIRRATPIAIAVPYSLDTARLAARQFIHFSLQKKQEFFFHREAMGCLLFLPSNIHHFMKKREKTESAG